jgi:hypothetical protein
MALLTANGEPDEPANSYVFWVVAAVIALTILVGVVVGLTRIL